MEHWRTGERLYQIEPLLACVLATHGALALHLLGGPAILWLLDLAVGLSALVGTVVGQAGPRLAARRAFGLLGATTLLMTLTGGVNSPFFSWSLVLAAVYPALVPHRLFSYSFPLVVSCAFFLQLPLSSAPLVPLDLLGKGFLLLLLGVGLGGITDQLRTLAAERWQPRKDELTGLSTLRELREMGQDDLARSREEDVALTLLRIDCEDLKLLGRQYGHDIRDRAILRLTEALRRRTRNVDLIARIGENRFAVVLLEGSAEQSQLVVERLHRDLEERPLRFEGTLVPLRLTCGASEAGTETRQFADLMRAAEGQLEMSRRQRGHLVGLPVRRFLEQGTA